MNRAWQWIWLPCLFLVGALFAWRLQKIPSRQETTIFHSLFRDTHFEVAEIRRIPLSLAFSFPWVAACITW